MATTENEETLNDDKNGEKKENCCKMIAKKIWNWVYLTANDTAFADYSTELKDTNGKKDEYYTIDNSVYSGKNCRGEEIQGKRLDCSSKKYSRNTKKIMLAYEQAVKSVEWIADIRFKRRRNIFLFIGFSVSASLLLLRVQFENDCLQLAIACYTIFLCTLALYCTFLLIKHVKNTVPEPFYAPPYSIAFSMLSRTYTDYTVAIIEMITIKNLQLKIQSEHEIKIFQRYFYVYIGLNILLLFTIISIGFSSLWF